MTSRGYGLASGAIYLGLSLAGIALAFTIYSVLKGGSLGSSWLFFILGFAAAALGSLIELFDLLHILIYQYDLRLVQLAIRTASMLLFLTGLILYRRGLE